MKICISVLANIGEESGASLRAKYVYNFLKNDGYDACLLAPSNSKSQLLAASKLPVFAKKLLFPAYLLKWKLKMFKEFAGNKYDLLFSIGDFRGFPAVYRLSKIFRFKILFEAQAILSEEVKNLGRSEKQIKKAEKLELFCIKNADFPAAVSENICEFYEKINPRTKLISVCNFDTNLFRNNPAIKNKIRERYGIKDGEKLIGVVGPFGLDYNRYVLEFLYKNISSFKNQIKFLVIGQCDNKIDSKRIIYTGYLDSRENYAEHIIGLDALIVPSKIATSGPLTKILEAMSCSLPVFITPAAAIGLSNFKHSQNLFIFEEEKFAGGINKLIFDDDKTKQVGEAARKTVEKFYDAPAKASLRALLAKIKNGL